MPGRIKVQKKVIELDIGDIFIYERQMYSLKNILSLGKKTLGVGITNYLSIDNTLYTYDLDLNEKIICFELR